MTCRTELSAGQLSPRGTEGRCSRWYLGSLGYLSLCRRNRCAMRCRWCSARWWFCPDGCRSRRPAARDRTPRRGRNSGSRSDTASPRPRHVVRCRCATAAAPSVDVVLVVPPPPSPTKAGGGTSVSGGIRGGEVSVLTVLHPGTEVPFALCVREGAEGGTDTRRGSGVEAPSIGSWMRTSALVVGLLIASTSRTARISRRPAHNRCPARGRRR